MNYKALSFLALFVLSGCVTNDMLNNNFIAISPEPAPKNMAGNWTGSMTSWLVTFKIDKSGEGIYCYSSSTKDGMQKIKYGDSTIFIQDGTKFDIKNSNDNELVVQAPYMMTSEHTLYRDEALEKASVFCSENL